MRILTFLLLLICITTTVIPCCAVDRCSDEIASTAATDKEQEEGTCSPFFTCASCPSGIVTTQPIGIETPAITAISYHPIYHSSDLSSYSSSFWQPPRLS